MITPESRELERRGLTQAANFSMKQAKFYCPKNWEEAAVHAYGEKLIGRWLEQEAANGWELKAEPLVSKIKCVHEADLPADKHFGRAGFWHPYMLFKHRTIPYDHPYVADRNMDKEDLYMVWAPMSKLAGFQVVERDDAWLDSLIAEDSPLLRGMVIH